LLYHGSLFVEIDCNQIGLLGALSGVDNTVSTGGKAVVFNKNASGPPSVTPLANFPKLRLLLLMEFLANEKKGQMFMKGATRHTASH